MTILAQEYNEGMATAVLVYAKGDMEAVCKANAKNGGPAIAVRNALMTAALMSEGEFASVIVFEESEPIFQAEKRCVDGEWAWWVQWPYKSHSKRPN
jgi:hypothetical protein